MSEKGTRGKIFLIEAEYTKDGELKNIIKTEGITKLKSGRLVNECASNHSADSYAEFIRGQVNSIILGLFNQYY